MLTSDEVLNLNYYKKTSYTGWINGMRFLIRREAPEEGDAFFHAWVWPGPLIFSLTDDSLKTDFTAPFTNEVLYSLRPFHKRCCLLHHV